MAGDADRSARGSPPSVAKRPGPETMTRNRARSTLLVALAFALLSLQGCASDGARPNIELRDDPPPEWQRQPGFTPFSA